MKIRLLAIFIGLIVASLSICTANAATKVALVIGNSAYEAVPKLPNPSRDADSIAEALRRLGFDVSLVKDANKTQLERQLADFSEKTAEAEMSVVFYAGHGMEIAGENYLIPVDATLKSDTRVKFEAVSLNDILSAIEGGSGVKLVLLDACRDNPYAATMRGTKTRSIGRGLAKVEAADGIYVSYAAAAGTTAADGDGEHSPYTEALLANIEEPGLELNFLFRKVARYVKHKTSGIQTPFEYGRLPDVNVYLKPPVEEVKEQRRDPCLDAAAHWAAVAERANRTLFEQHLEHFGGCVFAGLAKEALKDLDAKELAALEFPAKVNAEIPATNVEEKESTDSAIDDAANKVTVDENPTQTALVIPQIPTPIVDLKALTRSVQEGLSRVGCYTGKADGDWGRQSRNALERFNKFTKASLKSDSASEDALSAIKLHHDRVCPLECAPTENAIDGRCERKICAAGQVLNTKGICFTKNQKRKERPAAKKDSCFMIGEERFCS